MPIFSVQKCLDSNTASLLDIRHFSLRHSTEHDPVFLESSQDDFTAALVTS